MILPSDSSGTEVIARSLHELMKETKSTAAVVLQHPFGGFNMSGTDAKTGTADYLTNFMNLKSITEDLNS